MKKTEVEWLFIVEVPWRVGYANTNPVFRLEQYTGEKVRGRQVRSIVRTGGYVQQEQHKNGTGTVR